MATSERASLDPRSRVQFTRTGIPRRFGRDIYHWLRGASWTILLLTIAGGFFCLNMLFAGAYVLTGAQISNAIDGSYLDAFFFSIQTMATIGYGVFAPVDAMAHVLVTVEAILGMLITATATGLIFAKFATPTARITFSNSLVIRKHDGVPTLFMRLANERASFLVEARVQITLLRDEVSREGESMRRFYTLPLARDASPVFAMGWTVMHPIDEKSPLFGMSPERLEQVDGAFMVSVTGIDETLAETIHARHYYGHTELRWNARFVDMIFRRPNGDRGIDFSKLHDYEMLEQTDEKCVLPCREAPSL